MTTPLWTSAEATSATGGKLQGDDWEATGVSIDTRTLEAGDLFVAIEGLERDGHEFVAMAEAAGAAAVLISKPVETEGPSLLVEDTLEGMNALARAARNRVDAKVAAVTGSVGKTGTKEALRKALSACAKTHVSEASYNNLWGVPLSLARMPADTELAVFEIGMNHPGEIIPLVEMVKPDVAVITTVAPVHLEFFKDVTEIAEAKAEIFTGLKEGGTAIINGDIPHFELLKTRAEENGAGEVLSFGEGDSLTLRLQEADLGDETTGVTASFWGEKLSYTIGAPGKHWALNSLAVLGTAKALGCDMSKAASALIEVSAPKGRGERHEIKTADGKTIVLIDESYNANPASMRAALETLAAKSPQEGGRRIAVLGDMRELGDDADELHAALKNPVLIANLGALYCCGPHMAALWAGVAESLDGAWGLYSEKLIPPLLQSLKSGDVVMVKGSLGTNMAPIVRAFLELDASKTAEKV